MLFTDGDRLVSGHFPLTVAKEAYVVRTATRHQGARETPHKSSHSCVGHHRATGREAQVEKRMARREAARERDSSPVLDRLPGGGGDIMGGEDSFAAARAR